MDKSKSKVRLIYNTCLGIANKFLICVLGMFLRRIFMKYMGAELSGLSNLYQNIIEFLNLATAGFITAIYPRLYQYNADNNYSAIQRIVRLSRQFYYLIALFIVVFGIGCSFFLEQLIYDNQYTTSFLRVVFLLQVITQSIRMISAPNVALLSAREQGYYGIWCDLIINIFIYISQMIIVLNFRNYFYYLLIGLVGNAIYVIVLDVTARKLYPWAFSPVLGRIEKVAGLFHDLKNTIVMQFANFIFNSTDSIVISRNMGLVYVNSYGNYMAIATAILAIYTPIDTAVRNYFGNKMMSENLEVAKNEFLETVTFIYFVIGSICAVEYIVLITPFITLWLGEEYVQPTSIEILFGSYIFFQIMYNAVPAYLQIRGMFDKDMRANISSALINLFLSIIFVRSYGIGGVLMGTIIGLSLRFIQRTFGCYKNLSEKTWQYIILIAKYCGIYLLSLFLAYRIIEFINMDIPLLSMALKGIVGVVIVIFACIIMFHKKFLHLIDIFHNFK
ncbi:MAG: lipopolysaccharide biosynthesis protein [Blautia sp.]|nr:lipopolysaccharide biosynthesis protein [Blautia sp.]